LSACSCSPCPNSKGVPHPQDPSNQPVAPPTPRSTMAGHSLLPLPLAPFCSKAARRYPLPATPKPFSAPCSPPPLRRTGCTGFKQTLPIEPCREFGYGAQPFPLCPYANKHPSSNALHFAARFSVQTITPSDITVPPCTVTVCITLGIKYRPTTHQKQHIRHNEMQKVLIHDPQSVDLPPPAWRKAVKETHVEVPGSALTAAPIYIANVVC